MNADFKQEARDYAARHNGWVEVKERGMGPRNLTIHEDANGIFVRMGRGGSRKIYLTGARRCDGRLVFLVE